MSESVALLLRLLRRDDVAGTFADADAVAWRSLLDVVPKELLPYLAWRIPRLMNETGTGKRETGSGIRRDTVTSSLPADVTARLETALRSSAIGYLPRRAVLRRLASALDDAGIPFVVLKGAALAHLAWPEPSLRGMGDIDIWTHPEQLDRTAETLAEQGIPYSSRMELRRAAASPIAHGTSRVLEAAGMPVVVELHGLVRSMDAVAPDWGNGAWDRAASRDLGGISALVLSAEDMLTHLAVHTSAHHQFEMGLRPLVDIALWLEREGAGIDWPGMVARWRGEGCQTWCCLTLALAEELLGAAVPAAVVAEARAMPAFAELRHLARVQVLDSASTLPPTLARLAATPSTEAQGRWLLHRLTTWYWQGPPGVRRGPVRVVRDAAGRMSSDLRTKLPAYLRGFRDGTLRGTELERRQQLAVGRRRLLELVREVREAGERG